MKQCSRCREEKELSEFRTLKDATSDSWCRKCRVSYNSAYETAHRQERTAERRYWSDAHLERARSSARAYRAENKENINAYQRAQYLANPEKNKANRSANKEKLRAVCRAWQAANRDKDCARSNKQRAEKLCATPSWGNPFFIEEIYHLAQLRTKATGIKWHVDHIVPLKSKTVCGLHVEHNLRVIPAVQNISKGNRQWPDMPQQNMR